MRPVKLFLFILFLQLFLTAEKSFSEMKQPTPVLIVESETTGVIWQSIVDILWHEDKLFILDNMLSQAHVIASDGEYLGQLAGEGDGPGDLRNPSSISINNSGNIVICSPIFGKCDEFDGRSNTLLRSFTLHNLDSESYCTVFRVEWQNDSRYEHYSVQRIEGTNVIDETRISQFKPDGMETVLYKHLTQRDWKEWNEQVLVPFTKEGWAIDENGSLWCAEDWEKPTLSNPQTGRELILGSYLSSQRSKEHQAAIRNEVKMAGGIETIETWSTNRAVHAIKWESGMRLLGEGIAEGGKEGYILCGEGIAGGQTPIQPPFEEKENKLFMLDHHLLAFIYDEAMEYESAWGETIQGPCLVVVSYED